MVRAGVRRTIHYAVVTFRDGRLAWPGVHRNAGISLSSEKTVASGPDDVPFPSAALICRRRRTIRVEPTKPNVRLPRNESIPLSRITEQEASCTAFPFPPPPLAKFPITLRGSPLVNPPWPRTAGARSPFRRLPRMSRRPWITAAKGRHDRSPSPVYRCRHSVVHGAWRGPFPLPVLFFVLGRLKWHGPGGSVSSKRRANAKRFVFFFLLEDRDPTTSLRNFLSEASRSESCVS